MHIRAFGAMVAVLILPLALMACSQPPSSGGVTAEELRSVVREVVAEEAPSAEEIKAIVESAQQPSLTRKDIEELESNAIAESAAQSREPLSPSDIQSIVDAVIAAMPTPAPAAVAATPEPLYGKCGEELNVCAKGSFDNVDDTAEKYKWQCLGANGGVKATCSFLKPLSTEREGICTGIYSCNKGSVRNKDSTAEYYLWQCLGPDVDVTCSRRKSGN